MSPGPGLGAFGAVSWFLRDAARWPVRSDNPYHVFACEWAKRGSGWGLYVGGGATFECEIAPPYNGFACSAMLATDNPPTLRGGGLFFRRGGYGGRTVALRNRRKVCVFEGAPRLGVGCEGWKMIDFQWIC